MQKNINKILLLLLMLIMPISVLAQECTTPGIGGDASSDGGGHGYATGCTSATCLSTAGYKYVGVRFQIYKYDGTGANNIKLVGNGVDVWATNGLNSGGHRFSSASTPNLKYKARCTTPGYPTYPGGYGPNHPLSFDQYMKSGNIRYDSNLSNRFASNTVNKWAFTHNGNKPTGGWLAENLLYKLMDGSKKKIDEVKKLFGLTDAEINDLRNYSKDYYLTAEVLYRFWQNGGYHYLGTVSEAGQVHGYGALHNALYIKQGKDPNVGKVVPQLIKKTYATSTSYMVGSYYNAKEAACNVARGYAIWNLEAVCWECGYTCETACKYTSKGTQERAACAVAWCNANEPDKVSTCFKGCTTVPKDVGCSDTEKKCSEYKADPKNIVKKTGVCDVEINESNKDGKTDEVSARICYDDNKSFDDDKDVSYVVSSQNYSNIKYYKIICDEKMKLTGLPNEQRLYLTEDKTANLHFSYVVTYNKTCKLFYKTSDKYRKTHKEYWIQFDYKGDIKNDKNRDTKLTEDYYALENAKKGADKLLDEYKKALKLDPSNEQINKNIKIQEQTKKNIDDVLIPNLKKTITNSTTRLESLAKARTPEELKVNEVKLKTYKYEKIKEQEDTPIALIPLTCTKIDETDVTKKNYLCLLNGINVTGTQTITINGEDYICNGTGGTISGTGTTMKYEEVIVYSVPDSYVSTQTNTAGNVYHTEKDCSDTVRGANGFCKVIDYSYTFPEFDGKDIVDYVNQVNSQPDKLTFSLQGGLCDELAYDYKCDYKLEAKYCSECDAYPEGSDAYIACYKEKCSCDAYCGSDQVCRDKYCPEPCEGCNWTQVIEECTDCSENCDKYSDKTSENYLTCFYDECCTNQCNGECGCTYSCCTSKCEALYHGNAAKLKTCNEMCYKDLETCKNGADYLYRNISLSDPFPDRGTKTGNIGSNWYNKEKFITNTDELNYKDETDGTSDKYEYKIKINSKQLKKVKELVSKNKRDETGYKDSTSYKSFGKSSSYISRVSAKAYCSKFLHEDLANLGIDVSDNYDATINCRNIG